MCWWKQSRRPLHRLPHPRSLLMSQTAPRQEGTNYEATLEVRQPIITQPLQFQSPTINGTLQKYNVYPLWSCTPLTRPLRCIRWGLFKRETSPWQVSMAAWKMSRRFGPGSFEDISRGRVRFTLNAFPHKRVLCQRSKDCNQNSDRWPKHGS